MKIIAFILIGLTPIPAGWCLVNLVLLIRKWNSPTDVPAHLLAALTGALMAIMLWQAAARHLITGLLCGVVGAACGVAWFYRIYHQSLHNTTM